MNKVCCIKGCDREVEAMGMCVNHYRMTKKHGSPVAARPLQAIVRGMSMEERFWYSVEITDGCWEWKASKTRDGYGVFKSNVGNAAHRYSWYLHTGEVLSPETLVMHTCDNRACVNPAHLRTGTAQDNSSDMVNKGRQSKGEVHSRAHAKFTEEQVRAICADARPYNKIASEYGCGMQTIIDMKARRTWHFLKDVEVNRNKRGSAGEARSKLLTEDDVRAIRASTETGATLAKKYNLSQQTVCDIRKLRSWKHIKEICNGQEHQT